MLKFSYGELSIKAILEDLPGYSFGSLGTSSQPWGSVHSDVYYTYSDERMKENILTIDNALGKVMQMNPVRFDFKPYDVPTDTIARELVIAANRIRSNRVGFLAQEMEKIVPEAVKYDTTSDKYMMDYIAIIPVLTSAIKEQQAMIELQNSRIALLESEMELLKSDNNLKSAELTTSVAENENIAALFQNEPNPFTGETVIKYYLPVGFNSAFLYIYNMNGNQLQSISITQPGSGTVTISSSKLGPGMYLYALFVDGKEVGLKRMVVME